MGDSRPITPTKLLVVDDHLVVLAGFSSILSSYHGVNVVGLAQSGAEALAFLKRSAADVLLLDLQMPGLSGLDTLIALQKFPFPPRVIILSSFEPDDDIYRAVELGALGYLPKDSSSEEIVEAVRAVHAGRSFFPPWIVTRIAEPKLYSNLSPREIEVLEMVAKGLTNKEIGRSIQVSHLTVRNHVANIIAKLEVGGRTEASTVAIQQGIIAQDSFRGHGGGAKSTSAPPARMPS